MSGYKFKQYFFINKTNRFAKLFNFINLFYNILIIFRVNINIIKRIVHNGKRNEL